MTDKIGQIRNPLTIIAIFAGIAEVSGTVVLPFVTEQNQELFIYFLIAFPSLLVIIFFATLNFNNKVLYAPSDFRDENNYISVNKYDVSKQRSVEVKLPKDGATAGQMNQVVEKIDFLSTQITSLEGIVYQIAKDNSSVDHFEEAVGVEFLVSNFRNADEFIRHMRSQGVNFQIYYSPTESVVSSYADHEAIWLGTEVPLDVAQLTIGEAKKFYRHLKYIKLSDPGDPDFNQIYIGGSTESAVAIFERVPLKDADFSELTSFTDIEKFHRFIDSFKVKN